MLNESPTVSPSAAETVHSKALAHLTVTTDDTGDSRELERRPIEALRQLVEGVLDLSGYTVARSQAETEVTSMKRLESGDDDLRLAQVLPVAVPIRCSRPNDPQRWAFGPRPMSSRPTAAEILRPR